MTIEDLASSPEGFAASDVASDQGSVTDQATATAPEEGGSEEDQLLAALEEQEGSATSEASELVDIEFEGKTFKVDSSLKDAFMRNADYTHKTQGLADDRKAFEAEQAKLKESMDLMRSHVEETAQIKALENQYQAKFGEMTREKWLELQENDPLSFQRLKFEEDSLLREHSVAKARLNQAADALQQQQLQEFAKLKEQGEAELREKIPGWSTEKAQALGKHAVEQWGLPQEQVGQVYDPKHVQIMHKAMLYDQLVAKRKAKPKQQPVEPITKVSGGKSAPPKGLADNLSTEEWMKRRNAS